jgi:hypothetical protein
MMKTERVVTFRRNHINYYCSGIHVHTTSEEGIVYISEYVERKITMISPYICVKLAAIHQSIILKAVF